MAFGILPNFPKGSREEKTRITREKQVASMGRRIASNFSEQIASARFRLPARSLAERSTIAPPTTAHSYNDTTVVQFLARQGIAEQHHSALVPLIHKLANETRRKSAFYRRSLHDDSLVYSVIQNLANGPQWHSLEQLKNTLTTGRIAEDLLKKKATLRFIRQLANTRHRLLVDRASQREYIPKFEAASKEALARENLFLTVVSSVVNQPAERVIAAYKSFSHLTSGVTCRMPLIASSADLTTTNTRVSIENGQLVATTGSDTYGRYEIQISGQQFNFVHDFYIHSARTRGASEQDAGQIVLPRLCLEGVVFDKLRNDSAGRVYLNSLRGLLALTDHDYLHQLDTSLAASDISTPKIEQYHEQRSQYEASFSDFEKWISASPQKDDYEISLTVLHREVLKRLNQRCKGAIGKNVDNRLIKVCELMQQLSHRKVLTPVEATYCMTVYMNFFSLFRPITRQLQESASKHLTWQEGLSLKKFHQNISNNLHGRFLVQCTKKSNILKNRRLLSLAKRVILHGISVVETIANGSGASTQR